jgi:hypothetical protein
MNGGTINGNTATTGNGGGVHARRAFTKTGGMIYGSDAPLDALKNTTASGNGQAVYVNSNNGTHRWRDATAGPWSDGDLTVKYSSNNIILDQLVPGDAEWLKTP